MPKRRYSGGATMASAGSPKCYGEERLSTETVIGQRTVIVDPTHPETSCWLFDGKADEYGTCRGKIVHRFVYTKLVGKIPAGHVVHHICEHPGCVNPRHLDASMTVAEHTAHHHGLRRSA